MKIIVDVCTSLIRGFSHYTRNALSNIFLDLNQNINWTTPGSLWSSSI